MNVLFLTLVRIDSILEHGIYTDLLREFIKHGDRIWIVTPNERRTGFATNLEHGGDCSILHVKTGNMQKTNTIEKGISTLLLEWQYKRAIEKHITDVRFDLILYSTPPITLTRVISWIKKRDGAKAYLLLKDIFPQNAVDLGMLSTKGVKGMLYRYFRTKEKRLYALSDRIGCMSQANVDYVVKHNPEVDAARLEVCPNSIEPQDVSVTAEERNDLRTEYGLPLNKRVFIYGGNLGKPQDVPFIIRCLDACKDIEGAFFFIVGSGTDYPKLQEYMEQEEPEHVKLLAAMCGYGWTRKRKPGQKQPIPKQ